jgi:hypothetical protein
VDGVGVTHEGDRVLCGHPAFAQTARDPVGHPVLVEEEPLEPAAGQEEHAGAEAARVGPHGEGGGVPAEAHADHRLARGGEPARALEPEAGPRHVGRPLEEHLPGSRQVVGEAARPGALPRERPVGLVGERQEHHADPRAGELERGEALADEADLLPGRELDRDAAFSGWPLRTGEENQTSSTTTPPIWSGCRARRFTVTSPVSVTLQGGA